jgi:ribosome-binding factor A
MSSRRTAKVAEAVREQVSTAILFGLKDPRVKHVTVTRVEVSPDLRSAKVYVSVMGDEKTQRLTLRGLESARGFLQAKLAERVQIRYTPVLHFELDQGVKRSIEASRLLREVLPQSTEDEPLEDDLDDETGDELVEDQAPNADADTDLARQAPTPHDEPPHSPSARALEAAEDQERSPTEGQP